MNTNFSRKKTERDTNFELARDSYISLPPACLSDDELELFCELNTSHRSRVRRKPVLAGISELRGSLEAEILVHECHRKRRQRPTVRR